MLYIEVLSRHRAIKNAFQQVAVLGNRTVLLLGALLPSYYICLCMWTAKLSKLKSANIFRWAEQILYVPLRGLQRESLRLVAAAFFLFVLSEDNLEWAVLWHLPLAGRGQEGTLAMRKPQALSLLPEAERNTPLAFASWWGSFLQLVGYLSVPAFLSLIQ